MEKNKIDQLHKLSFLKRNELYTSFLDNFSINLGEIENNPFLGYVGKEYSNASKKLCFVGKSGAESTNFSYNDKVMNDSFWIGVYPGLTDEKLKFVIKSIKEYIKNI